MVKKRPRDNLRVSLIRWYYGVENPDSASQGQERAGHLWTVHRPRRHLILSLLFTSLSQSDILEGLSILSGLSGRVGQLVSCTRVSS